jgi:hypothetical protein
LCEEIEDKNESFISKKLKPSLSFNEKMWKLNRDKKACKGNMLNITRIQNKISALRSRRKKLREKEFIHAFNMLQKDKFKIFNSWLPDGITLETVANLDIKNG